MNSHHFKLKEYQNDQKSIDDLLKKLNDFDFDVNKYNSSQTKHPTRSKF
jgi:hypothetical protein